MADGGKILGGSFTWGIMIRSCQGWGSFTKAFYSNLKSAAIYILNFLLIMKGYILKMKP